MHRAIHTQQEFLRKIDKLKYRTEDIFGWEQREKLAQQIATFRTDVENTTYTKWRRKETIDERNAKLKQLEKTIKDQRDKQRKQTALRACSMSILSTLLFTIIYLNPLWNKLSLAIFPVPQSSEWTPYILLFSMTILSSLILLIPTFIAFVLFRHGYDFFYHFKKRLERYGDKLPISRNMSFVRTNLRDTQNIDYTNLTLAQKVLVLALFWSVQIIFYIIFAIYVMIDMLINLFIVIVIFGFAPLVYTFYWLYPVLIPALLWVLREIVASSIFSQIASGLVFVIVIAAGAWFTVGQMFKSFFLGGKQITKYIRKKL